MQHARKTQGVMAMELAAQPCSRHPNQNHKGNHKHVRGPSVDFSLQGKPCTHPPAELTIATSEPKSRKVKRTTQNIYCPYYISMEMKKIQTVLIRNPIQPNRRHGMFKSMVLDGEVKGCLLQAVTWKQACLAPGPFHRNGKGIPLKGQVTNSPK